MGRARREDRKWEMNPSSATEKFSETAVHGRHTSPNLTGKLIERFDIAGYARISVDDEQEQKNISIENQKAIIEDYVKTHFPGSTLTFFEDRDRSGYTFEQREGYQEMRRGLMSHKYDILIIKDFSRFSRRNSRGLVELEDLRDAGVRIVSIGDGVDFPNDDDWLKIQFQFLVNEMPFTDTSRKVRSVVTSSLRSSPRKPRPSAGFLTFTATPVGATSRSPTT